MGYKDVKLVVNYLRELIPEEPKLARGMIRLYAREGELSQLVEEAKEYFKPKIPESYQREVKRRHGDTFYIDQSRELH